MKFDEIIKCYDKWCVYTHTYLSLVTSGDQPTCGSRHFFFDRGSELGLCCIYLHNLSCPVVDITTFYNVCFSKLWGPTCRVHFVHVFGYLWGPVVTKRFSCVYRFMGSNTQFIYNISLESRYKVLILYVVV